MADRLRTSKDGKPLRLKESTVSNLIEFLGNFEFRNVTDDAELQSLVREARGLLEGVQPVALRSIGELRTRIQTGMANLATQLDTMLIKSGNRKFRFEEEDS